MVYNLAVYKNENGGFNGVFADSNASLMKAIRWMN